MLLSNTGWPRADNAIISRWAAAKAASSLLHCQRKYPQSAWHKPERPEGLSATPVKQWKACGTAGLCRHCIAIKPGRSPRHCKQHWLRHFKYVTLRLFLPLFSSPVKNYLFQLTKVESHKQQRDICIFKKWLTFPNSGSLYHHKLFPGVFKMSQVSLSLGMACQ